LHQQGKLTQAEHLYEEILARQPNQFNVLHQFGILRYQQGRYFEALRYMSAALKVNPRDTAALSNCGLVLATFGRYQEALAHYEKALGLAPYFVDALSNRGNTLRELGRPEEALASFDKAIALSPDYVEVLTNRGHALADLKRLAEALQSYDKALAMRPDFVDALCNRGKVLKELKRPDDALANYDRALALNPSLAETHINRGDVLVDLKRFEEGLASYDRALALKPDYADAFSNRGNALRELGRPEEALMSFDRALALNPRIPEALSNRGAVLTDLKRPLEALVSIDKALALNPRLAEAHSNRGTVLADLQRPEEALESYDKALGLKPDYAEVYDNKGLILTELGRLNEASRAIDTAIKLAPRRVRSYYNLAVCKRLSPGHSYVRAMEELARDLPLLTTDEQIDLHFALGKVYADIEDHERSFWHLLDGNALKRKQTDYDEAVTLREFDRTQAVFTGELMRGNEGVGEQSSVPVFILGMPRSGSTLVEQILASHPKVFGAGEITEFGKAISELGGDVFGTLRFPESVSLMSDEQLRQLGASYISRIRAAAPTSERITDKRLENFRSIGLIHLALPNARIIHTRRDPVDTCLSCFSKRFVRNLPYSYDLGELGRYYRAYEALMAHWHRVLPPQVMLDVQYEEVVADLEGQARRIVAHCGVEWDARCLDFHKTERPVRTASAAQVRQPIYKSSVGRWRAYEPFLGPLLTELQPSNASIIPDRMEK
jgi:tetratricopeptide (TPR) repeat protein